MLLATSPRVAPGLLCAPAWDVLRSGAVVESAEGHPLVPYLDAAGVAVRTSPPEGPRSRAERLLAAATAAPLVWLVGPDGDAELGRALGELLEAGTPVELEVLPGSYDLPGARLLDLVAVMDRLRSPGGCPWDAEQTHASLMTYLVEETYETLEAIETGDRHHLREELGDLLLQILFHAVIAEEQGRFDIDDVAADLVVKLRRRNPHVFDPEHAGISTGSPVADAETINEQWERIKAEEKQRAGLMEGVPQELPALLRAVKAMDRLERAGGVPATDPASADLGERLLALVVEAREAGIDPEQALRSAVRGMTAE